MMGGSDSIKNWDVSNVETFGTTALRIQGQAPVITSIDMRTMKNADTEKLYLFAKANAGGIDRLISKRKPRYFRAWVDKILGIESFEDFESDKLVTLIVLVTKLAENEHCTYLFSDGKEDCDDEYKERLVKALEKLTKLFAEYMRNMSF